MHLLKYIAGLLLFASHTDAYVRKGIYSNKSYTKLKTIEQYDNEILSVVQTIKQKSAGFFKLIRPENIVPTALLSATGTFIVNPAAIFTKRFWVATTIALLVMSNSMVINDIFDIELDRINNPLRPLITGQITKREAVTAAVGTIGVVEIINNLFMPSHMRWPVRIANMVTILYTPFLKRIPIIKNLVCANLISFSTVFSAMAVSDRINPLVYVLANIIYWGSFHIEILLDIADAPGDKKNNITTIPVLIGNDYAWKLVNNMCIFNILSSTLAITSLYDFKRGAVLMLIMSPLLHNLGIVKKREYDRAVIKNVANLTLKPLLATLLYLCILSRFI
jgi:geranylgeranylglycerol-phosphate geranylgeranyltransferase